LRISMMRAKITVKQKMRPTSQPTSHRNQRPTSTGIRSNCLIYVLDHRKDSYYRDNPPTITSMGRERFRK